MAYALGVIDRRTRSNLDYIREVRNACAHSSKPISFRTPEVKAVANLILLPGVKASTPRMKFVWGCIVIGHDLAEYSPKLRDLPQETLT
ncbi:MAG: DUF4145 domain-containing protein [Rhodospirillaceae bacterium]